MNIEKKAFYKELMEMGKAKGSLSNREIMDVLHEYEIKTCYFGHIHGTYHVPRTTHFEGIDFVLCAADYLNFAPLPIRFD